MSLRKIVFWGILLKNLYLAAVAAAAMAFTPMASALTESQISVGISQFDDEDASVAAITGRLTGYFTDYFGVEGELSLGGAEDDIAGVDVALESMIGAFGVARYPVTEKFDVFGRLGYAASTYNFSSGPDSIDAEIDGVAFGAGALYRFTETFAVRADYTRLEADSVTIAGFGNMDVDGGLDAFSLSIVLALGGNK